MVRTLNGNSGACVLSTDMVYDKQENQEQDFADAVSNIPVTDEQLGQ